jgi:glutathione S-transferase
MRATRPAGNLLITIPISHYCERARWALDRIGIPYRESAHIQAVHRAATLRAGGGLTVPVLGCAAGVLRESAEILAWADAQAPYEGALYPADPERAADVRALEADWEMGLGPHARRWMYQQLRTRRDIALDYGCVGVPAWERAFMRAAYPLLIGIVAHVLDVTPTLAAESERAVRAAFAAVGERLGDGRPYLCGEQFTAADLTFATMAAPVLMPPGYSVPLPQPAALPPGMAATVEELRAHPAGVHALAMFARERSAQALLTQAFPSPSPVSPSTDSPSARIR